MLIDTHTHLYLDDFEPDKDEVVLRALESEVEKLFLPNIDSSTIENLLSLTKKYPDNCFPMMGLHPSSVKADFLEELEKIEHSFSRGKFIAIGEIGIDLYWDKQFQKEQEKAFEIQLLWAIERNLPVVIHSREAFPEIFSILDKHNKPELRGVFHSFTGGKNEVEKIMSYDFYFGINGIVSFKNSNLPNIVKYIPQERILLETDSPYLAPSPKRGKRNESSYLRYTCEKLAQIYNMSFNDMAELTTNNALSLFNI